MTTRTRLLTVVGLLAVATMAPAATPAGPETLNRGPWPHTWTEGALTLSLFQPEVQRWEGGVLTYRVAAQVKREDPGSKDEKQTYGVVELAARTVTDLSRGEVTLIDVTVVKTEFPSVPEKEEHWKELFQQHLASHWTVPLERLKADVAMAEVERARLRVPARNQPPSFVFRTNPALLVLVDGSPAWRPIAGTSLERVVNTKPLLLREQATGRAFLRLLDGWMVASSLDQKFVVAGGDLPADLERARTWAATQPQIDLLDGKPPPDAAQAPPGEKPAGPATLANSAPEIVVATTPTELIVTDGQPQLETIAGTRLLTFKNSSSDVLIDPQTNTTWVLVAGRWFSAPSTSGPWSFVEPTALPEEFRRIPPGSARETVLSSIPGTPQARESVIANQVPQTATVRRSEATFAPTYEGEPQLEPIEGTALQYVLNSKTPVIRVSDTQWFAVENGVWFTAAAPSGPWIVATFVPPAVYSIPATSPVHNVTYVHVYDSTPEEVYVGYTPGYLGTYVDPGGVVFYGTGYAYPSWIGASWWWGAPVPYGYGIHIGWNPWVGWGLWMGWGWRPPGYGWGYGCGPYWGSASYYRPHYASVQYGGYRPPPPPPAYYRGGAYGRGSPGVRPVAVVRPPVRPPPGQPGMRPPVYRPPPASRPPPSRPPQGRPPTGNPGHPSQPAHPTHPTHPEHPVHPTHPTHTATPSVPGGSSPGRGGGQGHGGGGGGGGGGAPPASHAPSHTSPPAHPSPSSGGKPSNPGHGGSEGRSGGRR